jgi:hypothetical protein|tara:strand:+ start:211 stop:486 length:276 start_codon:yes stop_codon:yes gene_type:complete
MFEIKNKEGPLNITTDKLFDLILKQCFVDSKNEFLIDVNIYAEEIAKTIKKDLLSANLNQLFSIYFMAGYHYKVFLNKNEVTINRNNKEEK